MLKAVFANIEAV